MKVVILAGGFGTRLAEETAVIPKPMVEIGARPMIWHIMKYYAHFGFKDFYIAVGYKGEIIKKYFLDYFPLQGDVSVSMKEGKVEVHGVLREDWQVHIIDTGLATMTGGRLKRLQPWLTDETFMLTYGDGVSDVDLNALLRHHNSHGRLATVTAVRPPARFGGLVLTDEGMVEEFKEKPQIGEGWINGGFMVINRGVFSLIKGDDSVLERDVLERLAFEGELGAYRHVRFWQCMDTVRDKRLLESLWQEGRAPWKVWN